MPHKTSDGKWKWGNVKRDSRKELSRTVYGIWKANGSKGSFHNFYHYGNEYGKSKKHVKEDWTIEKEYSFLEENEFTARLGRKFVSTATKNNGIKGKLTRGLTLAHGAGETWLTTQAPFVMPAPDGTAIKHLTNAVRAITPKGSEEATRVARRKAAVATGRLIRHPVKSAVRMGKRFLGMDTHTMGVEVSPEQMGAGIAGTANYLKAGASVYGHKAAETAKKVGHEVKDKYARSKEAVGSWLDRVRQGVGDVVDNIRAPSRQLNPAYAFM